MGMRIKATQALRSGGPGVAPPIMEGHLFHGLAPAPAEVLFIAGEPHGDHGRDVHVFGEA